MATIKDIAKKLNLSISTVSKGFSNASDISEETRQLILNTALEMGYISKKSSQAAVKKNICIFVENMGYQNIEQFGYEVIVGFKLACQPMQWNVDIVPKAMGEFFNYNYEEYMLSNHYSAGFLLGFTLHNNFLNQLCQTKIPTVLLDNLVQNPHVACVGVDNVQGVACAIEHLYNLGHRSIALMNGEEHSMVSQERLHGFKMGMHQFGLSVRQELIAFGQFNSNLPAEPVQKFMTEGATAIVCASDMIAHGVLEELYRMKVRVPDEISVVGFDDLPMARYTTPSLTTVKQNRLAIGKSVCLLIGEMLNGSSFSRLLLTPELVARNSTGPAPKP